MCNPSGLLPPMGYIVGEALTITDWDKRFYIRSPFTDEFAAMIVEALLIVPAGRRVKID